MGTGGSERSFRLFMHVLHVRRLNSPPVISHLVSRRQAWLAAVLPLVALPLILAGCGGSSSGASPTTTTTPSGAGSAAFARYTQCLISHGVPASVANRTGVGGRRASGTGGTGSTGSTGSTPTGNSGPGGTFTPPTTTATERAARQACASLRPTGGFGGSGGFNSQALAAYRNCLQLHGVTLPTTSPTTSGSGAGGGGGSGGGLNGLRNNPAFAAASKACASLLPARGTTSTTAPSA